MLVTFQVKGLFLNRKTLRHKNFAVVSHASEVKYQGLPQKANNNSLKINENNNK